KVAGPKVMQERARLKAGLTLRGRIEPPSSPSQPAHDRNRSHIGVRARVPSQDPTLPTQVSSDDLNVVYDDLFEEPTAKRRARTPLFMAILAVAAAALGGILWFALRAGSSSSATPGPVPEGAVRVPAPAASVAAPRQPVAAPTVPAPAVAPATGP